MEPLEQAAFAELSGIQDSVSDAESDTEVVVVPEDAAPAAEGGDGGEQEVDFDSMGLEELEARITEAEKSIEVEEEEARQDEEGNEPPAKKHKLSEEVAKKRTKQYSKYTLGYRLKALRLLDQNQGKLRTTARQLVLKDKKTLREWRDNREAIVAEVRSRLKANQRGTTRCRLAGGGSKPLHQEVEVQLVAWLTEQQ